MRELFERVHARLASHALRDGAMVNNALKTTRVEMSDREATVWVYDVIGDWGVSAAELVPVIESVTAPAITVRVNSPGGDYFAGVAIANALVRHPANVTVHVDALAASAASVIAMAGDDIVMHPGARMMIHDALTATMGNAAEHVKTAELLDGASDDIAGVYAARSGKLDAGAFRALMREEKWYSAQDAVEAGLATRVAERELPEPEVQDAGPRWLALLRDFRAELDAPSTVDTQTPPAELPTAEDQPEPVVARRSPIAALFRPAPAERKAP